MDITWGDVIWESGYIGLGKKTTVCKKKNIGRASGSKLGQHLGFVAAKILPLLTNGAV